MLVILLVLFLALVLFSALGFVIHLLWFVALAFLVFWLVGFALGRGKNSGSRKA